MFKSDAAQAHLETKRINAADYDEALIHSLKEGNLKTAAALVTVGVSLNPDKKGKEQPLLLAAEHGNAELVLHMLQHGANIRCTDEVEKTSRYAPPVHNAMFYAARGNNPGIISLLVKKGLNPKEKDKDGWTVLHEACQAGSFDAAKYLVEKHCADLKAQTTTCQTPFFMACSTGNLKLVKYLAKKGANIHHTGCAGHTVMIWAAMKGHDDCVRYLIDLGCDINVFNIRFGGGVPHYAVGNCSTETVQYMLDKGGNLAKEDYRGENCAFYAATGKLKNKETVRLLIQEVGLRVKNPGAIDDEDMRNYVIESQHCL